MVWHNLYDIEEMYFHPGRDLFAPFIPCPLTNSSCYEFSLKPVYLDVLYPTKLCDSLIFIDY